MLPGQHRYGSGQDCRRAVIPLRAGAKQARSSFWDGHAASGIADMLMKEIPPGYAS